MPTECPGWLVLFGFLFSPQATESQAGCLQKKASVDSSTQRRPCRIGTAPPPPLPMPCFHPMGTAATLRQGPQGRAPKVAGLGSIGVPWFFRGGCAWMGREGGLDWGGVRLRASGCHPKRARNGRGCLEDNAPRGPDPLSSPPPPRAPILAAITFLLSLTMRSSHVSSRIRARSCAVLSAPKPRSTAELRGPRSRSMMRTEQTGGRTWTAISHLHLHRRLGPPEGAGAALKGAAALCCLPLGRGRHRSVGEGGRREERGGEGETITLEREPDLGLAGAPFLPRKGLMLLLWNCAMNVGAPGHVQRAFFSHLVTGVTFRQEKKGKCSRCWQHLP